MQRGPRNWIERLIQAWAERDGLLEFDGLAGDMACARRGTVLTPGMRRAVRGGAKIGWWTVTMKLPGSSERRREALRRGRLTADDAQTCLLQWST